MTSLRPTYVPHGLLTPNHSTRRRSQGRLPLGYGLYPFQGISSDGNSSRTDYSLLTPNYSLITMSLISFGALAQRYYPDKTYRTATRLFRRELEVTKGLLRALKRVGYSPTCRLLTSTQVRVIEEFIGEADPPKSSPKG